MYLILSQAIGYEVIFALLLIARKTASKSNEIPLVQEMMEEFPLQNMIITLDALHCQTKTLKAIKDSGNDYVVQVKENQKNS